MVSSEEIIEKSGQIVSGLSKFIVNHPGAMVAGGAAAGIWMAHPIRKTHPFGALQQALFNDPHASARVAVGEINFEVQKALSAPFIRRQINGIMTNYNTGNAGFPYYPPGWIADSYGGSGNPNLSPNGNVVFGMYNSRMSG